MSMQLSPRSKRIKNHDIYFVTGQPFSERGIESALPMIFKAILSRASSLSYVAYLFSLAINESIYFPATFAALLPRRDSAGSGAEQLAKSSRELLLAVDAS